jgi:hypothetical protein
LDLAVFEIDPLRPIWDSQRGGELKDAIRAAIEVKLISWRTPKRKNKDTGIQKDLETLEDVRNWCGRHLPLFHLVLDESFTHPEYQARVDADYTSREIGLLTNVHQTTA